MNMNVLKDTAEWRNVAIGFPAISGKDGWIEYHFATKRKVKLAVNETTGTVDYHELGLLEKCAAGQRLATLHPPVEGASGLSPLGEILPYRRGVAERLVEEDNTSLSADGTELYAKINGHIYLAQSRVVVSPVFHVIGSVGPETGNIHFVGSVVVSGGVEDGYSIQATERVVVGRTVGRVQIEAGGDIEVRGGMSGHGKGSLHAGGDIRIRFLQEATVHARGSIFVAEAVLHSKVESGDRILVGAGSFESRRGVVVGGHLRAHREVSCRTLGTPFATKTVVEAGVNPWILRRAEVLARNLKKEKRNFANVRKGVLMLRALSDHMQGLPAEKERLLQALLGVHASLSDEIARILEELRELEAQGLVKVEGRVTVIGRTHVGVRIQIGNSAYDLAAAIDRAIFIEREARIRIRPLEYMPSLDQAALVSKISPNNR